MVNFGEASAFPHGSTQPQHLKKGDVVLMDCGCLVQGYASDISRTLVFGAEPTPRQHEIWNLEKKAQLAGFAAAQLGAPCENVDAAARKVLTDAALAPVISCPACRTAQATASGWRATSGATSSKEIHYPCNRACASVSSRTFRLWANLACATKTACT